MTTDSKAFLNDQEMTRLRDRVVSALAATAEAAPGPLKRNLNQLADFLAYGDLPQCVLKHSVLLEIFLLIRDISSPTQKDVDVVVEQTIARTFARTRIKQPWWMVLFYPLVVFAVCGIVVGGICLLVVPTFEKMFTEFGLTLPAPTLGLIALSHAVQSPTLYVGLVGLLIGGSVVFWLASGNDWKWNQPSSHGSGPPFRRDWFPSKRTVWADWAWHVSLLLRFGKPDADAIVIAGEASGKRWLRHGSELWASGLRAGNQPFKDVTHFRGQACHLMSKALNSNASNQARAELLEHVSEVYWDREQSRKNWQLRWVAPIIISLIGLIVWFIMMALFMPLVELITGLS